MAVASLAAYAARAADGWRVQVVQVPAEGRIDATVKALLDLSPDLVVAWCLPEPLSRIEALFACLRPLLPAATLALAGPAIASREDAAELLARLPQADLALRGEAEPSLAELMTRPVNGSLAGIGGVTARADSGPVHGPDRVEALDPALLPSPLIEGLLPTPTAADEVWLEVQRHAIPFSPLAPSAHLPPRPLPLERLEAELARLLEAEVARLYLAGGPLDLLPGHLRHLLQYTAGRNRRTSLSIELGQPPDEALVTLLAAAGVGRVSLRPASGPGEQAAAPLPRAELRHLVAQGIRTRIELPFGRPGDTVESVRRQLDYYLTVAGLELRMTPLRVWPGHPLRSAAFVGATARTSTAAPRTDATAPGPRGATHRSIQPASPSPAPQAAATPAGLVIAGMPEYRVLATPTLPFPVLDDQARFARALESLTPYLGSMRLLARTLAIGLSVLLQRFVQWERETGAEPRSSPDARERHLARYVSVALGEADQRDRLPSICSAIEFETWLARSRRPSRTPKSLAYDARLLDQLVLARMPGIELRTFPYDVATLLSGAAAADAPVHRTHLLLRRNGVLSPQVWPISEQQKLLMERIDGVTPLGTLVSSEEAQRALRSDLSGLEPLVNRLVTQGALYVRRIGARPEIPSGGSRRGRILSFRAGASRRPRLAADPEHEAR